MRDTRMDRLPRWAQDEIARLNADLATYKKQARQACGDEPSNVMLNTYDTGPRYMNLPRDSTITFVTSTGGEIVVRVEQHYIEVRSGGAGSDNTLLVQPQAANVVRVKPGRWW